MAFGWWRWIVTSAAMAAAGCTAAAPKRLTVWVEAPSHRLSEEVTPRPETGVFSQIEGQVRLMGAAGETVACQVVVYGGEEGASGVEVGAEPYAGPGGTIGVERVALFVEHPVTVRRFPSWYLRSEGPAARRAFLDVLVPAHAPRLGQPVAVAPRRSAVIWYEVSIPRGLAAGRYESRISVRVEGRESQALPVVLHVLPFELPAGGGQPVIARVDVRGLLAAHLGPQYSGPALLTLPSEMGRRARRLVSGVFRLLQANGLSPYLHDVFPVQRLGATGGVEIDWTDYDALIGPWLNGTDSDDGAPVAAWPLPVDSTHPRPEQFGGLESAVYARILRETLEASARHFAERGWLDRAFVSFEERGLWGASAADYRRVAHLGRIVELAGPRLRLVSTIIPQAMHGFGWAEHPFEDVSTVVDVLAPPAQFEHLPTLTRQRRLGKTTWLVPDRPPFSGSTALPAPPAASRSLPWHAFLQGHEAVWLREVAAGPADVLDRDVSARSEGTTAWLYYPGSVCGLDEPLPSLRLKQLMLGQQEAALLQVLSRAGRGETARLLAGSLVKATGTEAYVDHYQDGEIGRMVWDPRVWDLGRRIAAREASAALGAWGHERGESWDGEGAAPRGADRNDWEQFLGRTRGVEVWIEGLRIISPPQNARDAYLVEVTASVRNGLTWPVAGRLRFGALPRDWQAVVGEAAVDRLDAGATARRRLQVRAPRIAIDLYGHGEVPVSFEARRYGSERTLGTVTIPASLSAIVVPPAPGPLTLDGALDDWPPAAQNVAGDFRLVGNTPMGRISELAARHEVVEPAADSDRGARTLAYVCRDERFLYVGLRCLTGGAGSAEGGAAAGGPAEIAGGGLQTNVLEYDDLVPVGEDLVEILLDPSNIATSSSDIYHVVIKSSGPLIAELGIGCPRPFGRRRSWAGGADIRYARRGFAGGWSAEIAIPLEVFRSERSGGAIWGTNITRYEPGEGAYSNWARAARYCYGPWTFGNLVWVGPPG